MVGWNLEAKLFAPILADEGDLGMLAEGHTEVGTIGHADRIPGCFAELVRAGNFLRHHRQDHACIGIGCHAGLVVDQHIGQIACGCPGLELGFELDRGEILNGNTRLRGESVEDCLIGFGCLRAAARPDFECFLSNCR